MKKLLLILLLIVIVVGCYNTIHVNMIRQTNTKKMKGVDSVRHKEVKQ